MNNQSCKAVRITIFFFALNVLISAHADNLVRNPSDVPHRGVFEISLTTTQAVENPYFDVDVRVIFVRPDETRVTVDGFYDGNNTYKARAYCDTIGEWKWSSVSNLDNLNHKTGTFKVVSSKLKGKLRKHPEDPRQFVYDNGEWYLHIGDTGYRFVTDSEPNWKAYIDQADQAGFTKIRTWFCKGRSDVQVLFSEDRSEMNLPYWKEIDRRLTYSLNEHPHIIFQLIPYGEDTAEIKRYGEGDRASIFVAKYTQARFSSFPNVLFCISNDRHIVFRDGEPGNRNASFIVIHKIGLDMMKREPWGTLLTNHQQRFQGYSFTDCVWSDIITLEDMDQVDGRIILQYFDDAEDPIVLDEDRYENYRNPEHHRYFFRRLMWGCLLSGGSATYGGMKTYEAYDGELSGIYGYYDALQEGKLKDGAHDYPFIHKFFDDTNLTLVGMKPSDAMTGYNPQSFKCIADQNHILVYLQNPDSRNIEKADVDDDKPVVTIQLPRGHYQIQWYQPTTGKWFEDEKLKEISGGYHRTFNCPFTGDAILYLKKK